MPKMSLLLILALASWGHAKKFDTLAQTPPMGWNSWNKFACNIDELLIRQTADALVSSGMHEAGYRYLVLDDCWHGARDEKGFIQPDPKRFPSGMKALGDYIHAKGLRFGIYSDAGWKTCGGRPGSRGHEYQDAMTYAAWGVDYLKYDWCNTEGLKQEGAYQTMREALFEAGRPVVFSLCEWGGSKPWLWAKDVGHLWRTTGDIHACWDCEDKHPGWSAWGVMRILDMQEGLRNYAGPGHWNDPDMLEVGNGMSTSEDRSHFSMWCMLAAPLMAGSDVQAMSAETKEILTNKEVIAVDQDALGIQGFKAWSKDGLEAWFKPLDKKAWAVCFLNRGDKARDITWVWAEHEVKDELSKRETQFASRAYKVRDLWAKKALAKTNEALKAQVGPHDVLMLKLER